jgi:hypothetical protein
MDDLKTEPQISLLGTSGLLFEAPGAFDLDGDQIAFVVDVTAAPEEKVVAAAKKCPTHAITVRRDGEQLT